MAYRDVSATDIATGGLQRRRGAARARRLRAQGPHVPSDPYGYKDLGPKGRENLKAWVQDGGRYVGWLDGGVLASALGISGTVYGDGGDAGVSTPGSLFRVRVNDGSPLAAGVGPFAWALDDARYVLPSSGAGADVPLRYPGCELVGLLRLRPGRRCRGARRPPGGDGRARRPRPRGRVRLRPELPRVRGRDGEAPAQRGLRGRPGHGARAARPGRAPGGASAGDARRLTVAKTLRRVVRARGEGAAARCARLGAAYRVPRARKRVQFVIDNPGGAQGDEHPYARQLGVALRAAKVPVVMYRVP